MTSFLIQRLYMSNKCQVSWSLRPSGSTLYRQPSPLMYVGSTKISVDRMSVYRWLLRTQHVQAELALRYWRQHSNLHCFSLIKVASLPTYKRAWTVEHLLIDQWQPRLNFPFVTFFLQRTALGFRHKQTFREKANVSFGRRLLA